MRVSVVLRWVSVVVLAVGVMLLPSAALAANANLSVTKTDSPDPVAAGSDIIYTITVANSGPDAATSPSLSDSTPANTTFVSVSATGGWTCPTAPGGGGTGAVGCSGPTLVAGSSVMITLVVKVNAGTAVGTIISNSATASSPDDPSAGNNSDTETTSVSGAATGVDLRITKSDSPDPVSPGANITYAINVTNLGPASATSLTLTDAVPANTTFVSLSSAAGWTCTTPSMGGTGTVSCTIASLASGAGASFSLVVKVNAGTALGTGITNTATIAATSSDPNTANNSFTATTSVGTAADFCASAGAIEGTNGSDTLTGTSGDDVICGGNGSDTINGLGGNDMIFGQNGRDVIDGGEGNDTVAGANGKDQVTGGTGTDILRGGNAADVLNGQDGAGGDSLDGGRGQDTCQTDTGDTTTNCP